jgi:hypothetical protein
VNEALSRLATLIAERNRIDAAIAGVIGRPGLAGHIGEYIASAVFDVELEVLATAAGIDGRFRSGALAGRSVNVKLYGKREGLLDIAATHPDFFLVLTGPKAAPASSRDTLRPLVIDEVFLFDAPILIAALTSNGVRVGTASSVRSALWDEAHIWPGSSARYALSPEQDAMLAAFRSPLSSS